MKESLRTESSRSKKSSQFLRQSMNIALMGILNSCTVQKPVSTDNLTPYPSAREMLNQPFTPETNPDVRNLSNFFLQSAQKPTEYVDDNGVGIPEGY